MEPPPPTLGSRALFPRLSAQAYLAYAAISPPSLLVEHAVAEVLTDYGTRGALAFLDWAQRRIALRQRVAHLIGADPTDIALTPGTTHSLSQLAFSLAWQPGDCIVLLRGEFPANVTPWLQAAKHFGLEVFWLTQPAAPFTKAALADPHGPVLEELKSVLRRRKVRLVATSAVQFQTGLRMPLAEMGRLCRSHGAELAVDAIQACGAVPINVIDEHVDYLACGAHKWLLGLEGAGFTYLRAEHARRLVPRLAGWQSHQEAETFLFQGPGQLDYGRPFQTTAAVLEGSSANVVGMAALEASLGALLDLGVPAIFRHVQSYLDALELGLVELGFRSLRAQNEQGRSCILSVAVPEKSDGARVVAHLKSAGITVSYPDGFLRFAPHFSSSPEEIPWVLSELQRALGSSNP